MSALCARCRLGVRTISTSAVVARGPWLQSSSSAARNNNNNNHRRRASPPSFGDYGGSHSRRQPFRPGTIPFRRPNPKFAKQKDARLAPYSFALLPDQPQSDLNAGEQQDLKSQGEFIQVLEIYLRQEWMPLKAAVLKHLEADLAVDSTSLRELTTRYSQAALDHIHRQPSSSTAPPIQLDLELLSRAYASDSKFGLDPYILRSFLFYCRSLPLPSFPSPTLSKLHSLSVLTDFTNYGELLPQARKHKRTIVLHVGPTNSGKTYSALLALSRSKSGVYAAPLRLLAHEVFTRFNEGKIGQEPPRLCNLITGEEQRILDPNLALSSCTVEMFPLSRKIEVGVIDEIQMLGDAQRGSAWTNALIGAQCRELHLCGEESVVELVKAICEELGDKVIINRYERLTPLAVSKTSLRGDLTKIRKGDCFVTFSRTHIFAFKRMIEEKTGFKVAVAYGGLPPEVREEQARKFNEGEYDVLVASDAVGMGLNLKIRRIVFETLIKFDGIAEKPLSKPQIKQIAGRAGRYGLHTSTTLLDADQTPVSPSSPSAQTTVGEVTTLDQVDMPLLREAMKAPVVQVDAAAFMAPPESYRNVQTLFPSKTRTSRIYDLLSTISTTSPKLFVPPSKGVNKLLDSIEHVKDLLFHERKLFASAPVNVKDPRALETIIHFTECFAKGQQIRIIEWAEDRGLLSRLESLDSLREASENKTGDGSAARKLEGSGLTTKSAFNTTVLAELESFHRCLTLYLWLSYRMETAFCDRILALPLRREVEKAIDFVLRGIRFERRSRKGQLNANDEAEGNAGGTRDRTRGDKRKSGRTVPSFDFAELLTNTKGWDDSGRSKTVA